MPRPFRRSLLAFAAAAAIGAAGCDSGDAPTSPDDPGPPPATVTETFSGNVGVNGAQNFNFASQAAGSVTATLTAITPDEAAVVGLSLGTWNGTACQIVIANDNATKGITVTGSVSGIGSLCVRIYDVGKLTTTAGFEITVVHP
jgi:hypothetical protein